MRFDKQICHGRHPINERTLPKSGVGSSLERKRQEDLQDVYFRHGILCCGYECVGRRQSSPIPGGVAPHDNVNKRHSDLDRYRSRRSRGGYAHYLY